MDVAVVSRVLKFCRRWPRRRISISCSRRSRLCRSSLPVLPRGNGVGQRLKGNLLMHLVQGCASSVLIRFVLWIHWRVRRHPEESLPKYRLPIEAVAVLLVGLTGHLGGFLSGVNGPG